MEMKRQFRFNLGYYFVEGLHSIFTHGLMSFAAVFMIVACLLLMGSFGLLAYNLERAMGDLEDENVFFAFVDENYTREQAQALQATLAAVPNVSSLEFVTKEQAKTDFEDEHAEDDHAELFVDLPIEIYRDRYVIYVDDIHLIRQTIANVDTIEGIAGHRADLEIADGLIMIRNVATGVAVILVALLIFISLLIIYNTIKLGTFTRREEIAIMKMVGATNGFVRGPFIFEGMIFGLSGALIAFFAQWGVYEMIRQAIDIQQTIPMLDIVPFLNMAPTVLAIFCGTGLVVGTFGSVLALRKFLQV